MREENLRAQISLGWITNLLVSCVMLTFMIVESILADNHFRDLRIDPGVDGPKGSMVYLAALYALMPVFVNLVNGFRTRLFRRIAVGAATLAFVFFFLHHMSHWYFGERPDFTSPVLDLILHAAGLWVLVNSIRWAKLPAAARDTDQSFVPDMVRTAR